MSSSQSINMLQFEMLVGIRVMMELRSKHKLLEGRCDNHAPYHVLVLGLCDKYLLHWMRGRKGIVQNEGEAGVVSVGSI